MFTSHLVKKRGMYKTLGLINMLACLIAPFINTHLFAVDAGAGAAGQKDKDDLLKEITLQIKSVVADSTKDNVKQADIDAKLKTINDRIAALPSDQIDTLKANFDKLSKENETLIEEIKTLKSASIAQGTEMDKMKNGSTSVIVNKKFIDFIREAIIAKSTGFLKTVNDDNGERLSMKEYFDNGNKQSPKFEVSKDAVDMLQSAIVGNYVANLRLTQLDPERVGIPLTPYPHAIDVIPNRPLQKPYMALLVVGTYVDGSATKVEGITSGKSSFLLTTVSYPCFDIATHFPISEQTLDDLDEVLAEISQIAPDMINDTIDEKIFSATNGSTTDITGLFYTTFSTAFTASTFEDTVKGANLIDLIDKMKLQVENAKYQPDTVGLNGNDISRFRGLKDALDNSISDRRVVYSNMGDVISICGLAVVKNNAITANTCFVGSSKKYQIGIRKGMTMEIGLNADDFTTGRKTIRFNIRLAFGIRAKAAFQYCADMDTDVQTIAQTGA